MMQFAPHRTAEHEGFFRARFAQGEIAAGKKTGSDSTAAPRFFTGRRSYRWSAARAEIESDTSLDSRSKYAADYRKTTEAKQIGVLSKNRIIWAFP
jgi:hypothetical protein